MDIKFEVFGKYILLEKLATGGMAEIYLAKAPGAENVSKFVAIKRILPQYCNNHEFIEMFKEEAKIAVNLTDANVVSIYEFGVQDNLFFLAMQYVDGKNLRQILNRLKKEKKNFSLPQIISIVKEAAKGLDHAHRCVDPTSGAPLNITHRDISPQNIMLSFEGEIKIIDFGIAKAESKIETTRAGTLKGKFGYMSPEQAEGFEVDFRTDIFSLGIVLWELLAQDRLFVSNNEINTLKKIRECHIPSLRKLDPNIPQELERITMKALTRDRTLRYQSAEEFSRDLNIFLNKHHPDYSQRDLSHTLKSLFTEEREDARKKMIDYAKIQFSKEEKTDYIERTTTVTEPNAGTGSNGGFNRASSDTSTTNNSKLKIDPAKDINEMNIGFNRQDLVRLSKKAKQTNTNIKNDTRVTNITPYHQTNTSYPYGDTDSLIIKDSSTSTTLRILLFIIIVCGAGFYVNQNEELRNKILDYTKKITNQAASNSSKMDPQDIAKNIVKDLTKDKSATAPYYSLLVTSIPSGASIYVNDKPTNTFTPSQVHVPTNETYSIRLEKEGYFVETKSYITTKQGEEVRMTLRKVLQAYININVSGGQADIFVNGKKISDTSPVFRYPIPAETSIKVQAYNAQHGTFAEKVIEAKPNTVVPVNLSLSSRVPSSRNP